MAHSDPSSSSTMRHSDPSRPPCPWRIVDDIGGAFVMGCLGSAAVYTYKGARNAPRGHRMAGAVQMIKLRSPVVGGNFAVWGGLFSSFECSLFYVRQKDDIWNPITAGALTGGVLAMRGGLRSAAISAAVGGVLLAMIEGLSGFISKYSADQMRKMQQLQEQEMLRAQEEQMAQLRQRKNPSGI